MKKVRILSQILVNGEPAEVDSIVELPEHLANELISHETACQYVEPTPAPKASKSKE